MTLFFFWLKATGDVQPIWREAWNLWEESGLAPGVAANMVSREECVEGRQGGWLVEAWRATLIMGQVENEEEMDGTEGGKKKTREAQEVDSFKMVGMIIGGNCSRDVQPG